MSGPDHLTLTTVQESCRLLRLPRVGAHCERVAQEAARSHHAPLTFLAELLGAELDERERHAIGRRLKEA